MSRFKISRRQLLGATSAVAGLVLARDAQVLGGGPGAPALGATDLAVGAASPAPGADVAAKPAAAWLDGMLTGDDLTQARATLAPLQPKVLEHDVLWQWRRELAQELRAGVRSVAITRWDKAFVLKGLAREEKLPVRQTRIGHSLFRTEIG
jgi:hypothetical protein